MSINIHFIATREVIVVKTGKTTIQEINFNTWQTPTKVTWEIMGSADAIQAYKDYVLCEYTQDEEILIYADDDIFGEGNPVGKNIYNSGKEHIAEFEDWLTICEEEGYTVVSAAW
jgi:hypothetical protein